MKPGVPFSTIKAEMPREPASGFVDANTIYTSASPPLVINTLAPSKIYSSPSRIARVFSDPASLPALGSVKQRLQYIHRSQALEYTFAFVLRFQNIKWDLFQLRCGQIK